MNRFFKKIQADIESMLLAFFTYKTIQKSRKPINLQTENRPFAWEVKNQWGKLHDINRACNASNILSLQFSLFSDNTFVIKISKKLGNTVYYFQENCTIDTIPFEQIYDWIMLHDPVAAKSVWNQVT